MKRWLSLARNERGNVLAIVIAMLTVLLLISGVAMDMGRVIAVRAELQRALDASALAGAGNLDPSQGSTIPSGVRSNAVSYAAANQYSGGNVTLNVLPCAHTLSAAISPPISAARRRQMASPRPVPS